MDKQEPVGREDAIKFLENAAHRIQARKEAIEEAARVAESCYRKTPFSFELGTEAAAAIRALGEGVE